MSSIFRIFDNKSYKDETVYEKLYDAGYFLKKVYCWQDSWNFVEVKVIYCKYLSTCVLN